LVQTGGALRYDPAMQTQESLRNYQIDSTHSNVHFSVRHLMISKVRGTFSAISGKIVLPPDALVPLSVAVIIDSATIDTREQQRDAHLRSADFLDTEHFPTMQFTSDRVSAIDLGSFEMTGDLEIRGTRRPVVIRAALAGFGKDPWGNDRVAYEAGLKISRSAWGLTWNQALEAGGFAVGDEIDITIDIEAIPAP
jgi:polyisoprenoid-binding protein YceI